MAHPVVRRSSGCEPHVTLDRAEAMAKIFFPLSIRYFKCSLLSSLWFKIRPKNGASIFQDYAPIETL